MSSLRLQTTLRQGMVLTPQLRQRIEMLQMTSLELTELVQQELVSNPALEEVESGDEIQDIADNIPDQNADGRPETYENGGEPDFSPENTSNFEVNPEAFVAEKPADIGFEESAVSDFDGDDETFVGEKSDAFEEIDYG